MNYIVLISFITRLLAIVIIIFFCIPLQVQEAKVKNGLRRLRLQLLLYGILLLHMVMFSDIALFFLLWTPESFADNFLHLINGIGILLLAIIGYRIYHQQYTPFYKNLHEKIEEVEQKKEELDKQTEDKIINEIT